MEKNNANNQRRFFKERTWTIESAKAYILTGKRGLKYCSALDFLRSHGEPTETAKNNSANQKKKKPFWKKKNKPAKQF